MIFVRRWSCQIVGLYSDRVITLNFCRFFTEQGARRFAERMDRYEPPDGERVTEVQVYYREWTRSERAVLAGAIAGGLIGICLAAVTLGWVVT